MFESSKPTSFFLAENDFCPPLPALDRNWRREPHGHRDEKPSKLLVSGGDTLARR